MVYGFVRQSGGTLTIDSRLGYGTRIALYLPSANAPAMPSSPRELSTAARGGEVVLVVEDEPDVRGIAIAFLKSLGYAGLVAANAEEALAVLRTHPRIDLLFSDVVLGSGMTGVDLAHEAMRQNPLLPVLLTSGYEHAMLDDDAPFPLLRKPYSREDFAAAVRQALDGA
jgi:CheY-like chemotaxis protein